MNTNSTTTANVTILATTDRGAKLITNGSVAAWVMGRQVREDGTLTAGALEALKSSSMTYEYATKLAAAHNGDDAARAELEAARREENRRKAHAEVTVNIARENWRGERGAAWQVNTCNQVRNQFGKYYTVCAFLPKSQVTVAQQADGSVNVTMPAWLLWNNRSMCCKQVA